VISLFYDHLGTLRDLVRQSLHEEDAEAIHREIDALETVFDETAERADARASEISALRQGLSAIYNHELPSAIAHLEEATDKVRKKLREVTRALISDTTEAP